MSEAGHGGAVMGRNDLDLRFGDMELVKFDQGVPGRFAVFADKQAGKPGSLRRPPDAFAIPDCITDEEEPLARPKIYKHSHVARSVARKENQNNRPVAEEIEAFGKVFVGLLGKF